MNKDIVIFDLDGTLIDSNSTFDFMNYIFGKNLLYKIYNSFVFKIANRISVKFFSFDFKRILNLSLLKGISKSTLESWAKQFYNDFINNKRIKDEILILLIDYLKTGKDVFVVTATLDFLGKYIVKQLCFQINDDHIITTEFKYNNDICTGRIDNDLLNKKRDVLLKHNIQAPYDIVVSDDIYDAQLMEESLHNYIVITKKNKNAWKNYLTNKTLNNLKFLGDVE